MNPSDSTRAGEQAGSAQPSCVLLHSWVYTLAVGGGGTAEAAADRLHGVDERNQLSDRVAVAAG